MSKFSFSSLFGSRRTDAVTIVDAPVRMTYARKARLTFWIVGLSVAGLSATVASHHTHPIVGLLTGAAIGIVAGLTAAMVVLAWPVLRVLWHWADAILAVTVGFYGWSTLMQTTDLTWSLLIVSVLLGLVGAVGPVRRRVLAYLWCAVVRHRLRLSFARMVRTGSRLQPGCLPLILIARPTPAGERVWVWLRPGLALPDLEAELPKLAVNCYADRVRVVRASRRYAAFIRVDISRRDPLRARVLSPLPGQTPGFDPSDVPVSPGMPPVGLDLADVPEPVDTPRNTGGRPRRQARGNPRTAPADPVSPDPLEDNPDGDPDLDDPFI